MSSTLLCRRLLAERDGTNRHYCRENFSVEELTVDHETPLMRGCAGLVVEKSRITLIDRVLSAIA
jgi:hypothetical protein